MIQTFIFDIDGTIIDTEQSIFIGLDKILIKHAGRRATKEDMLKVFGIPGIKGLIALGFTHEEATDLHPKWSAISREHIDTVAIFDGMKATLQHLKDNHHRLGIVTSKTRESFDRSFTPFGLTHLFDEIITSSDTKEHKPSGEPLTECLNRLDVPAEQAIYIGDSIFDNLCARNADVAFGLAEWGSHTSEGFDADHIFKKPQDILSVL
ncbi:Hypothetical protein Tpal_32 [Trichococcus palustris]|jgi:HAD superfamily hydrolase (TIGR01549 family)|uniref:Uncharacterized protein n=1 Tax=Trichococcus palustris TaxID=140314 RepID=A0A143Y7K4_9LACT|nr:HAD family hydrolase [Trichococcus palustris]CZQ80067.1 Hypothetical protein Tpal_32 [Trichococcus palustris]SFL08716.1 haloacid dehalogenase superfamily, subfamily IA, variant 1 with third motif having Dx(3-4)D or Dx(3-4)E [Trichococcus palustris]